ncbi:MAG: RnfABCDGE type electron transport complex subunit D [Candidatus Paceibacterota bacterium]
MKKIFQLIKAKLDNIAMYRTVTLSLSILASYSIILGFFGVLAYSGLEQVLSLITALAVALVVNIILGKLFKVHVNNESAIITALIIFFLVLPTQLSEIGDLWLIAAVTFLAILSKFVVARKGQHIFNPAAFGVFALALLFLIFPSFGYFESAWWVGTPALFIPLLLVGSAVVLKVRKWVPVLTFLAVAFVTFLFEEWRFGFDVTETWLNFWLMGPSLFLALYMLTEPFTMPSTKKMQITYAALVGFLSQTALFVSFIMITPELALIIGNLVFYGTRLRQKLVLKLVEKREVAKNTWEFVFEKPAGMDFKAGQYLEWMLPHENMDSRGIRRYFTIASAPDIDFLKMAVRFGDKVSSYKTKLKDMNIGDTIIASQLAGDFLLPDKSGEKLAFVAGGIGITPFLSHLEAMNSNGNKHETTLFYCNNFATEIAYKDKLDSLTEVLPFKVVNVLAKENIAGCEAGYVTEEIIKKHLPDYLERTWYISGPSGMVDAYTGLLKKLGVPSKQIVRDFFPGLA